MRELVKTSCHSEQSDSGVKNLTKGKFREEEVEGSQEMFHFAQLDTSCQITTSPCFNQKLLRLNDGPGIY